MINQAEKYWRFPILTIVFWNEMNKDGLTQQKLKLTGNIDQNIFWNIQIFPVTNYSTRLFMFDDFIK